MKIAMEHAGSCLGATGGTGRLVVRDAMAKGHSIVVLVEAATTVNGVSGSWLCH
jgi:putative NADH-flavin reductase